MAKPKVQNIVVDAEAINYARIASPSAKFETEGKRPVDLEWKADLLLNEDTVEKIEKTYPNLRKKLTPITPKKYKATYKVDMPEGVDGPHILKLSMPVAFEYKDAKSGETKQGQGVQPKVLLKKDDGSAKDITFEEYLGNNTVGKVVLMHRVTSFKSKPIDVLELGSVMVTDLVEVEAKPGQGGSREPDLKDMFGLEDIEESEAQAPEPNEPGLKDFEDDDSDVPFSTDDESDDDYE